MPDERWKNLPGAEIVLAGLSDIEAGRKSVNASAVQCAAPRLRRAGLNAPNAEGNVPAAHELYRQLSDELGDGAHARYNAILSRVASFAGPQSAALNRIKDLKEELAVNVKLASPLDFLPPLDGRRERSRYRFREGNLRSSTSTPTRKRCPTRSRRIPHVDLGNSQREQSAARSGKNHSASLPCLHGFDSTAGPSLEGPCGGSRGGSRPTTARRRSAADEHQPGRGNCAQPQADAIRGYSSSTLTEAAFDQLLRRLSEAGVEFVLIGGLAVNAWGVVRGTKDVDIVVAPDVENLKVVAEVAVEAGGHVQRGEALLGTPFSIAAELASGEQMAIDTELGRLDIVQGLEGVPSFDELRSRATETEVLGVNVAVCSVEDLRAMKQAAGRGQDLVDLENLDAAEG